MAPAPTLAPGSLPAVTVGTVAWRSGAADVLTIVAEASFGFVHGGVARQLPARPLARESLVPHAPGPDVVLVGHARAPGGVPTSRAVVRLGIVRGDRVVLDKTVHVAGNRAVSIDHRFFDVEPEDPPVEVLHGDEHLVLDGVHASLPRIWTKLPGLWPNARWIPTGGAPAAVALELETLVIDADLLVCTLTWRGTLQVEDAKPRGRADASLGPRAEVTRAPAPPRSARARTPTLAPPPRAVDREDGTELDTIAATGRDLVGRPVAPFPVAEPRTEAGVGPLPLPGAPWTAPTPASDPELEGRTITGGGLLEDRPIAPFSLARPRPAAGASPPAVAPPLPGAPWSSRPAAKLPFDEEGAGSSTLSTDGIPEDAFPAPPKLVEASHETALLMKGLAGMSLGSRPDPPPPARVVREPEPEPGPPPVEPPARVPDKLASPAAPPPEQPLPKVAVTLRDKVMAALAAGELLRGMDLARADLRGVDFTGATLNGCRMSGADLSGCSLRDAKLADADLAGAQLAFADLSGADLSRADLSRARGEGVAFKGATGNRARFVGGTWDGASFEAFEATSADFTGASLAKARFDGARLVDANLEGAKGEGAVFDHASLPNVRAESASFVRASFIELDAQDSHWERATLDGARFDGAKLARCNFERATFPRASFRSATLEKATLTHLAAEDAALDGANLEGVDLRSSRLLGASFAKAKLRGIIAVRVDFSKAKLQGADLTGANLRMAKLVDAELEDACLDGADLRDADLTRCDLTGASRNNAKLQGAKLKDAKGA